MEGNEAKLLKRQRKLIFVIGLLAVTVILSITYAFVQRGIAKENLQLAVKYGEEAIRQSSLAKQEAEKALRAEQDAKQQAHLAELARKDAEEKRMELENQLQKMKKR